VSVADLIREKAREHELNSASLEERGDSVSASIFAGVAIALYEVAEAIEAGEELKAA